MERDGIEPAIVNALAADLIDQVKKHSKTFGKLNNDHLSKAQDYVRTATTFGIMDFSLFAQAGEVVLSAVGTDRSVTRQIATTAGNFIKVNTDMFNTVKSESYQEYKDLGYDAEEIVRQYGVDYDSKVNKTINKYLFRAFGIAQTTDGIRMSRMAAGARVITNMAEKLVDKDQNNLNKSDHKLLERLQFYGANVPDLVKTLKAYQTLDEQTILNESQEAGVPNYVEDLHQTCLLYTSPSPRDS